MLEEEVEAEELLLLEQEEQVAEAMETPLQQD